MRAIPHLARHHGGRRCKGKHIAEAALDSTTFADLAAVDDELEAGMAGTEQGG